MASIGKYQVRGELGRGGMSRVFLAYDPDLDREVAIKVLAGAFGVNEATREAFLREARTIGRLRNDAIVQVHFLGEEQGQLYLVMEHMESGSLADRLQGRPLLPSQAIAVLRRVAGALDAAHQAGVVHRDIKPANILFDAEDRAFVSDFGVAGLAESGTQAGVATSLSGTPTYMSPEQAQGHRTTASSDLYSLAVTAFEVITGTPPFQAPALLALIEQHISQPPPAASSVNASLSRDVDVVLNRALAKSPTERYSTVTAFVSALADALRRRAATVDPGPQLVHGTPTPDTEPPRSRAQAPFETPPPAQPRQAPPQATPQPVPPARGPGAIPSRPASPPAYVPPAYVPPVAAPPPAFRPDPEPQYEDRTVALPAGAAPQQPAWQQPPAAIQPITGELRYLGSRRGSLLGKRTQEFQLTLYNAAHWPTQLTLDVSTDAARYAGEPLAPIVVPGLGNAVARIRIRDRGSRNSGSRGRHYVSVVATPSGGGGPPVALSGTFDGQADRLLLVVAGGALCGLAAGVVAAALIVNNRNGGGDEPDPTTLPGRTATAQPGSTRTPTIEPTPTRTTLPTPTPTPATPSIVSLNWPAQIAPGGSASFDLIIKDVNGDVDSVEFTETGSVTWSGTNVDGTGKVITIPVTASPASQRAGTATFTHSFNCNSSFSSRFQIVVVDAQGLRSGASIAGWTCR